MSELLERAETSPGNFSIVSGEVNRAHYSGEMQSTSSSFVVDIESFPTRLCDKEHSKTPTSRIIRNFSRKGSIRGGNNLANLCQNSMESPKGRRVQLARSLKIVADPNSINSGSPCSTKAPIALVAVENHVGSDHHHHVTITATDPESRLHPRRLTSGIRRSKPAFGIDPRKVLFAFATLSSLGSLILIYFTLAIKRMNEEASALTWQ